MPCSLPSATKVRNSAVLFRISNFFAIIYHFGLSSLLLLIVNILNILPHIAKKKLYLSKDTKNV